MFPGESSQPVGSHESDEQHQHQQYLASKPLAAQQHVDADEQDAGEVRNQGSHQDVLPITLTRQPPFFEHWHHNPQRCGRKDEGHDPRVVNQSLARQKEGRQPRTNHRQAEQYVPYHKGVAEGSCYLVSILSPAFATAQHVRKVNFQPGQEHQEGKPQLRKKPEAGGFLDQAQSALTNDDAGDDLPNHNGNGDHSNPGDQQGYHECQDDDDQQRNKGNL